MSLLRSLTLVTNSVNADATNDSTEAAGLSRPRPGGLADGALTVSATVTDAAGNSAPAVSASLTLDTVADLGSDLSGIFVDGDDSVMNADEAADGAILVSGFSAPDLQSVAATVTDGAGGITVTASLGDIANSIPPSVAATIVDYDGDVTVRFGSALTSDAVVATLVAEPMDPSVGGLTHLVDFTDPLNLAEAPDLAALFAGGQFYAQAYGADGSSLVSSLADPVQHLRLCRGHRREW